MTDLLAELKAALADTYEIENELGEGGMAFVFLARDLKHDRQVAIKILKPELAANLGAERFLREIQITARLSHPHVLPLYDSGVAGGYLYYVMPFVEGEPLSSYLDREKQLPIDEALKLAGEVAEALAYAHSYGLVHRDIKPDNIFLSRGHAIVADFGIARAVSSAGGDQLTQTGMAVGTPAYMSPEQAAGEPNLDGRTDVYALGCVLYEMLVGDIPFTGPNAMAIMARHSMDMITAPHIMRQSIPEDVEDLIYTAMAKTPADRFRTAQDMVDAIRAVERGGRSAAAGSARLSQGLRMSQAQRMSATHSTDLSAPARPAWRRLAAPAGIAAVLVAATAGVWQLLGSGSPARVPAGSLPLETIAVTYFETTSGDSLQYLADGLTESLISQLDRVASLDVLSPNAVEPFRGTTLPRDSIARMLNAGTLVLGTVEPNVQVTAGGELAIRARVTVRLVDGESGDEVLDGRASFEMRPERILAVRDSLAAEVARLIQVRLGEEVRLRAQAAATASDAAWTQVQRAEKLRKDARALLHGHDAAGALAAYTRADVYLAEAERADPRWPEPAVLRGRIWYEIARISEGPDAVQAVLRALDHAERALAIDANYPPALDLRGTARYLAGLALADTRRQQDSLIALARADLDTAVRRDPTLARTWSTLSHLKMFLGDKQGAVLDARQAYERDAYLDVADAVLHRLYQANYDLQILGEARDWCTEGRRRFPRDPRFAECQLTLMATGDAAIPPVADRAWTLADEMERLALSSDSIHNHHAGLLLVGGVLARAGLTDSARAVLDRARPAGPVDRSARLAFIEAYMRLLARDTATALERLQRYVVEQADQHHDASGGEIFWWWRPLENHPRFRELVVGG